MSTRLILGKFQTGLPTFFDPLSASTIISGRSRSGKSTALYSILAGLVDSPVRVFGCDPTGVCFNALGDGLGGRAFRVSTLRDPPALIEVMEKVVAVMDKRIDKLLAEQTDKFVDFDRNFPALLGVFEEYPGIMGILHSWDSANGLKPAERLAPQFERLIQRLALEGRKVGIYLLICIQRGDVAALGSAGGILRSQLGNRLSFAQDPDGLRMLHGSTLTEEILATAAGFLPGQGLLQLETDPAPRIWRADPTTYLELVTTYKTRPTPT